MLLEKQGPWMAEPFSRPSVALVIGVIGIGLGVMETVSGDAVQRFGNMVSRSEDSREFWSEVVTHYLIGVAAISYFLFMRFAS